jgi:hypothetical protein
MAMGTGNADVMAALILYHFFNRLESQTDTRFADMAAGFQGKVAY